jgi:sterol desaturase/sphingolipid hydroxylase (fatty acid hydroxylase superfamily)
MLSKASSIWAHISTSYDPSTVEFFGTLVVQLFSFWISCLIYLLLPILSPSFSERHKIQPAPKQPTRSDIQRCLRVVLSNQVLSTALHIGQLYLLRTFKNQPSTYAVSPTPPTPFIFIRDFILILIIREALFYYVHRLLHVVPSFYKRIHKRHHRFTAPIALAAQYAHPIEHIFANVLPITLPPQLLESHILTFWAYMAYELVNTATVHSGYDFFHNKAKMHDLHHELFNLNYGSIGLLDWVHGTDRLRRGEKGRKGQ